MTITSFPAPPVIWLNTCSQQTLSDDDAEPDDGGEQQQTAITVEIERAEDAAPSRQVERPCKCIRVLIVDDHEVVRKGIISLLCEKEEFEPVGQAATSRSALLLTQQLQPDIVLLDIFLGPTNGLDIAQQLMRSSPDTRIVVFTGSKDDEQLLRAMRLGVHGYVQKAQSLDELIAVLHAVARGERAITEPRSVTRILDEFSRLTKEQERMRSGLTDLEIELVRLAAEGCSNKEIAARQFWSEVTVKRKMQDIYRKLNVTDRAQAVAEAMRMGLI
jgi:NarL family two-component system response regulator LiaR